VLTTWHVSAHHSFDPPVEDRQQGIAMRHFKSCALFALGCLFLLSMPEALRAAQAQLNGNWDFSLDYEGGTYILSLPMVLDVKGEKVTGTHGTETFEGTLRDEKLEISGNYYIAEAGYASMLAISAVLEGDQIKGTATWSGYSFAVLATRAK